MNQERGTAVAIEPLEVRRLLSTVGYWRFENGTANATASGNGTILDSSGGVHNGSAFNMPVYRASVGANPVPNTGAANKLSLQFNGTNQRVHIPDSTAFAITKSLTIEAYINVTATTTGEQQILFRGDDRTGHDPYFLELRNGKLHFQVENGNTGGSVNVEAAIPGLGKWFHVAGVLDDAAGQIRLYVNGQLLASKSTTVRPFATLDTTKDPGLGIGNVQSAGYHEYFNGLIDEVRLSNVALTPSQFLDAPSTRPGTISGVVFHDLNGDGSRATSDPALSGWTVFLDTNKNGKPDAGERSTVTGAGGAYSFTNVAPGSYRVAEVIKSGWLSDAPTGGSADVSVAGGTTVTRNFADARPVSISGTVFNDINADGFKDTSEAGLSGWRVFIDANNNGVRDAGEISTTTSSSGMFAFSGLKPGTYVIRLVPLAGWSSTDPAVDTITLQSGWELNGVLFGAKQA